MAVDNISFNVNAGEIFGFIGPNGAGKTTTIKLILGLLRPTSGQINLMGQSPNNPSSRRDIGFLPEYPYFYDHLTGQELLSYYGTLAGIQRSLIPARVKEAVNRVKLDPKWLNVKLRTYSKGMTQRLGLAQAIMSHPKLLILDEPMSGLDPMGRRDVRLLIESLNQEGVTIFYSSHVLSDVEAICHRVAIIIQAKVRKLGTISDILKGENTQYAVTLEQPVGGHLLPEHITGTFDGKVFVCSHNADKGRFINWASQEHYAIKTVQEQKQSLEQVLAKEVNQPHL